MLWRLTQLRVVIIQTIRIVLILLVGTVHTRLLYVLHDAIDHSCVVLAEEHLFGKELVLSVAIIVAVVVARLVEAVVDNRDAVAATQQLLGGTQQQQAVVGRLNVTVVLLVLVVLIVVVNVVIVVVDCVVVAVVVSAVVAELLLQQQRLRRTVASLYGRRYSRNNLAFCCLAGEFGDIWLAGDKWRR